MFDQEQEQVMAILEPHIGEIHQIFTSAVDKYNEIDPAARAEHEDRTAASCVRDYAWMGFKTSFTYTAGFHFLDIRGLNVLNIEDKVVIRVKKVDSEGRHRNYQTQQQKDFDGQHDLDGLPSEALRIVVGYQPDVAMESVERVTVRRPKGNWVSQLNESGQESSWVDITPAQLPLTRKKRASKK